MYSHVLVVTGSGIRIIGGNVHLVASTDGNILIVGSVTRSDLGALGIKSNGNIATSVGSLGLTSVVNDRLVVLV